MVDVKVMLCASDSPASTAAGPCHNIIHEPTGLLNNTKDLETDVTNVLRLPEKADNANPLLFHYYSIGVISMPPC